MKFKSLHIYISIFIYICCSYSINGQTTDSTKLPFAIAHEKELSVEDLKNKKEGTYFTGFPDFSSDPVNGFGYGGEGSIYFNGKRTDPFFKYTAYRAKVDLVLFNTTKNEKELMVKLDIPYVFNSKWRLRMEFGYEKNPNLLYFGSTQKSLERLIGYENNDSSKLLRNLTYANYKDLLNGNKTYYNTYIKEEYILNISGERSYNEGKLRILVGYEIAQVNIKTFDGISMLQNDVIKNNIKGVGKGLVGIMQQGIIYDTRDLETDPGTGIFAELTNELSTKFIGSKYNFNKTFFHFNYYYNVLKKHPKRLLVAARVAIGYTAGQAPFFEFQDQWSSEGSIEGLGGAHTLRGYKQSRFLSRAMTFNNLEIRYKIGQTHIYKQHFAFSAVPFADAGAVGDQLKGVFQKNNYRTSEGLGLRIAWNVNTILRFDYAISKEDKQFFFNMNHTF